MKQLPLLALAFALFSSAAAQPYTIFQPWYQRVVAQANGVANQPALEVYDAQLKPTATMPLQLDFAQYYLVFHQQLFSIGGKSYVLTAVQESPRGNYSAWATPLNTATGQAAGQPVKLGNAASTGEKLQNPADLKDRFRLVEDAAGSHLLLLWQPPRLPRQSQLLTLWMLDTSLKEVWHNLPALGNNTYDMEAVRSLLLPDGRAALLARFYKRDVLFVKRRRQFFYQLYLFRPGATEPLTAYLGGEGGTTLLCGLDAVWLPAIQQLGIAGLYDNPAARHGGTVSARYSLELKPTMPMTYAPLSADELKRLPHKGNRLAGAETWQPRSLLCQQDSLLLWVGERVYETEMTEASKKNSYEKTKVIYWHYAQLLAYRAGSGAGQRQWLTTISKHQVGRESNVPWYSAAVAPATSDTLWLLYNDLTGSLRRKPAQKPVTLDDPERSVLMGVQLAPDGSWTKTIVSKTDKTGGIPLPLEIQPAGPGLWLLPARWGEKASVGLIRF